MDFLKNLYMDAIIEKEDYDEIPFLCLILLLVYSVYAADLDFFSPFLCNKE